MREKKIFGERTKTLSSSEPRQKYYLVYEGTETEKLYFSAVEENRRQLGLNNLIDLIPVLRSYSEKGWSNPSKILKRILKILQESEGDKISYRTLTDKIMDYFEEQDIFQADVILQKNVFEKIVSICENTFEVHLDDLMDKSEVEKVCRKIIRNLKKSYTIKALVKCDIREIIAQQNLTYEENFDKICFIIDRDKKSFTKRQYIDVLDECKKRNFGFYLSNPCFEFWLFLHFQQSASLSEEEKQNLLENPKIRKKTYAEIKLREVFQNYRKSNYDATVLIDRIDIAISNEKLFCEDELKLEHELGSRVGVLISEMLSRTRIYL